MEDEGPSEQEYVESDTQALASAIRGRAIAEVLYPQGKRLEELRNYVARLQGTLPDAYDMIALGVYSEMGSVVRQKAADADGTASKSVAGKYRFRWENVSRDAIIKLLEETSVSMGGGKGRKEGVELGKGAGPPQQRSRWGWRRRKE